jgi:hypothetical protein
MFIYLLGGLIVLYLLFTLICTYFVQQLPRYPVSDVPDWGRVIDTKITAIDGGLLEVWRIEPHRRFPLEFALFNFKIMQVSGGCETRQLPAE